MTDCAMCGLTHNPMSVCPPNEVPVTRDNDWNRLWNGLVNFSERYRREHGYSPSESARTDFIFAAGYRLPTPACCAPPAGADACLDCPPLPREYKNNEGLEDEYSIEKVSA